MLHRPVLAAVCTGLVLLSAADKPADKKAATTNDTGDKSIPPKSQLVKAGEVLGKVVKVDATEKTITVRTLVLDPHIADLNRQLQMQNFNTNPIDRVRQIANIQVQLAQAQQHPYKADGPEVVFQALDDVKIRVAEPPVQYDDKGNPKKLTYYERKALKGRGNSWGYPSDFDSLKNDQIVTILALKKKDTAKKSSYSSSPQDKELAAKEVAAEPHYTAEVHIVKDTER